MKLKYFFYINHTFIFIKILPPALSYKWTCKNDIICIISSNYNMVSKFTLFLLHKMMRKMDVIGWSSLYRVETYTNNGWRKQLINVKDRRRTTMTMKVHLMRIHERGVIEWCFINYARIMQRILCRDADSGYKEKEEIRA